MNTRSITGNESNAILINLNKPDDEEVEESKQNTTTSIEYHPNEIIIRNNSIEINNNGKNIFCEKLFGIIKKLRGVYFSLLAAFTLSLSKTIIKKAPCLIGSDHSFIRYILQFGLLIIVIKYKKLDMFGPNKPSLRKLLKLRGFFGAVGMVFLHFAITFIEPSDTVAITHCSVIITSILARLFLSEKFTMAHLISLLITLFGILFICQPSFIFNKFVIFSNDKNIIQNNMNSLTLIKNNNTNCLNNTDLSLSNINESLNLKFKCKNNELNSVELNDENNNKSNYYMYIGIFLALLGAFTIGTVETIIKKLCIEKVHYSISIIYGGYFGIPISLLISIIFYSIGFNTLSHSSASKLHQNFTSLEIIIQIGYSILSGLFGVMAQLFLNFALTYEDASKIAIFKTTDLIFTFLFQFYLIGIKKDLLSSIGAFLILFGTFLVLIYKFLNKKLSKKFLNSNSESSGIFKKILLFEF